MEQNGTTSNIIQEKLDGLSNATFWGWFFLFIAAVGISSFWVGSYFVFIFGAAFIGVSFSLVFSRWLAKRAHNVHLIDPQSFASENQKILYEEVAALCSKAGLTTIPEIGIYDSPDMNAFATGATQSGSLIAFSTGLLYRMPLEQVKAVAAHEIAHVVNRDALGIVLMQGIIDGIILIFSFPITVIRFLNNYSDRPSTTYDVGLKIVGVVISTLLAFIGKIVFFAFSRHREYRADAFSAVLVGNKAMSDALKTLSTDTVISPMSQAPYAAFKISGVQSFAEFFSTHPLIEKRIAALDAASVGDTASVDAAAIEADSPNETHVDHSN